MTRKHNEQMTRTTTFRIDELFVVVLNFTTFYFMGFNHFNFLFQENRNVNI